jgi:hypothetical protein
MSSNAFAMQNKSKNKSNEYGIEMHLQYAIPSKYEEKILVASSVFLPKINHPSSSAPAGKPDMSSAPDTPPAPAAYMTFAQDTR